MRYLMLIKHSESLRQHDIPSGLMAAMGEFVGAGFEKGVIVDTAGLKPTSEGHRIRQTGRRLVATDGPFVESKEVIGGYALMEFPSDAEALDYARQFMQLHLEHWPDFEGECEVRPVQSQ